jgi:hypothetical protein
VCKNPDPMDEYFMAAFALVGLIIKESMSAMIEPYAKVLT